MPMPVCRLRAPHWRSGGSCGVQLQPLADVLLQSILKSRVIHADTSGQAA